ncbi:hypothetical protein H4219_004220 [Mycoemilia scoparia]|uniref:O-methyltransferase n=1 Tax=Mycoemilia scoparia TaxID=417184 RepID=A0A9W7ZY58_9FUNG|nr:hypothetical protein H4219_004220 [Mycoemilia scoparia]
MSNQQSDKPYTVTSAGKTNFLGDQAKDAVQQMLDYSTFVSAPKESSSEAKLEQRLAEIHKDGVDVYKNWGEVLPIYPLQAYFLTWLMGFVEAKNVLEIGTFTGYSTIYLADALRKNGGGRRVELSGSSSSKPIITCELVDEVAKYAESNFVKAGVDDLIEVKVGKALDTIQALPKGTKFDFIFIDADKQSYTSYYKAIMDQELLSPKGVIVIDNTILSGTEQLAGREANPEYEFNQNAIGTSQHMYQSQLLAASSGGTIKDPSSELTQEQKNNIVKETRETLHAFNVYLKNDERVHQLNLPIFTGMTVVRLV